MTRRDLLQKAAGATLLPLLPLSHSTAAASPLALYEAGLAAYRLSTARANAHARVCFTQVLQADPSHIAARAMRAATHRQDGNLAWTADRAQSEALALQDATEAVRLARQPPTPAAVLSIALEQLGWVQLYIAHAHASAIASAQEALTYDPHAVGAETLWAHALTYGGEPAQALAHLLPAPQAGLAALLHTYHLPYYLGHACGVWGLLTAGDEAQAHWAQAELWLRAAVASNPQHRPSGTYLVVALWERGQETEARQRMSHLRAAGRPSVREAVGQHYVRRSLPYRDPVLLERLMAIWAAAEEGDAV
jgi:tetratricopeptide (TPR) repeat protein